MEKTKREKLREKSKKIAVRKKKLREKSKKIAVRRRKLMTIKANTVIYERAKAKRKKVKGNTRNLKNQTSLDKLFDKIKERKEDREKMENVSKATVMVCLHIDTFTGRPSKCYGRAFQITVSSTIDKDSYEAHVRTHNANDEIYKLADDLKYREEHPTTPMVRKWIRDHHLL